MVALIDPLFLAVYCSKKKLTAMLTHTICSVAVLLSYTQYLHRILHNLAACARRTDRQQCTKKGLGFATDHDVLWLYNIVFSLKSMSQSSHIIKI